MTTDQNQKPTRRELLAFIALADAPIPESVRFAPESMYLSHESIADMRHWMVIFGLDSRMDTQPYPGPKEGKPPTHTLANAYGYWRGQRIGMTATDPLTSPAEVPLDDATRAQLAQAAEPRRGVCRYCGLSIVADDRHGWIHSDGIETCGAGDQFTRACPINEPAVTR